MSRNFDIDELVAILIRWQQLICQETNDSLQFIMQSWLFQIG